MLTVAATNKSPLLKETEPNALLVATRVEFTLTQ